MEVLAVDCQATAAAPRGHLLEIGWTLVNSADARAEARLVAMPAGKRVPPAVTRVTGITDRMMRSGIDAHLAWGELTAVAATLSRQPAPTVIHFARFEQPFLCRLAGGVAPLDVVCTHAIAERLMPELPRRTLRALAGYFGRAVGAMRRSADHVDATVVVWRELVSLLDAHGVSTWDDLKAWLATPVRPTARGRRVWPMPRTVRLALPDAPGVYRMLRTSGDVLYVGKAASLRVRVNSYFRHQRGVPERMLEMLSQVRRISFEMTPSALEAALLEPDEIKRHRPPYNVALTESDRHVWFATPTLTEHSAQRSERCRLGPFPSAETLDQFAALARGSRRALGPERWAPDSATFQQGHARFCAAHPEMTSDRSGVSERLLRVGTRLWREGRRDREADADAKTVNERRVAMWTPEAVQLSLEWLVIRAALARRRAAWLTRLTDASVVWREPEHERPRVIVIENGDIVLSALANADAVPPIPPGHGRSVAARHHALTIARFDRLRVLTTELKRLTSIGASVAVRFGMSPPLADARLASALGWL